MNVDATQHLVRAAAAAGVNRFVFMSSVKVYGDAGGPFGEASTLDPTDAYGRQKQAAEQAVINEAGPMKVTILRPPLVYGPGVKANMAALVRLADTPYPLPFGAIDNARSFVALDTLADAVVAVLGSDAAAGRCFPVSDGADLSTPGLITAIRRAVGRPARLIPVPVGLLRAGLTTIGKQSMADRLTQSLTVDGLGHPRRVGMATAANGRRCH